MRLGRSSENVVAAVLGAVAFGVFSAGAAVAVTTQAVSITNPSTGVRAHVTNQQSLVTSQRDAISGNYAKVDAAGRQVVGDGTGALTVDGAVREAAPSKGWSATLYETIASDANGPPYLDFTIPTTGVIVIRTVSVELEAPAGNNAYCQLWFSPRDTTGTRQVEIPLTPQGVFWGGDRQRFVALADVHLYPKPGAAQVRGSCVRSLANGPAWVRVTLFGHYV